MIGNTHLSVVHSSPGKFTDEEIVAGLTARQSFAALALHEKYGSKINRLVWRMLGADAEHNDVVNQIFINVLKQIDKLKNPNALDSWIVSITLNTVRREIRDRKRRYSPGFKEQAEKRVSKENQEDVRKTKAVFRILNQLNVDHRIVFMLRYMEEYTMQEIADATGRSLSTVNRYLAAGKRQFGKRAANDVTLQSMCNGDSYDN